MKVLVGFLRIFVGIFFIISGFVKLNDPLGFSFKLQEYFGREVLNLEFLTPFALAIALLVVIAEIMLGFALIIGYLKKLTLSFLLLLTVFFAFLTFYSAYFNKVTDCGCFGDAMPMTPWQSFWKDMALLVMILVILFGQKYLVPFFSKFTRTILIFIAFIACLGFGYYVLMHLPSIDFRAYKVGVNITEGMQIPEDAPKSIYEYAWKFEQDGKEEIIKTQGNYPEHPGKFVGVETKLIQEGYTPPIHDFTIEKDGEDLTTMMLEKENLLVIVSYNIAKTEWSGWPKIKELTNEALQKGYEVIGLTASSKEYINDLKEKQLLNFDFYFTDETTLKTIIRSNPGILKLKKGTIIQKKHWNDTDEIILENLDSAKPKLDLSLKRKLDSISKLDDLFRPLIRESDPEKRKALAEAKGIAPEEYQGDLWKKQRLIDTSNLGLILSILDNRGYPGKSIVGEPTNLVALEVIKHNPEQISGYLDLLKEAGEKGEIPFTAVAALEDRYLMQQGKEQIYGTQAQLTAANGYFIWPIQDAEHVNERRKKAGFERTIEAYAKDLIGADYIYKPVALTEVKRL